MHALSLITLRLAKDRLTEGLILAYEGAFFGGGFEPEADENINTEVYKELKTKS